jgi:hypothetical protein
MSVRGIVSNGTEKMMSGGGKKFWEGDVDLRISPCDSFGRIQFHGPVFVSVGD